MRILVIGSGGREHALTWKIKQSPLCTGLYIAPGNGGTAALGRNIPLDVLDFEGIRSFVIDEGIDLVVVGPEAPLVAGIVDYFSNDDALKEIPVIGPTKRGAMLEGSKSYAKAFMQRHQIPTANFRQYDEEDIDRAVRELREFALPVVIKADGLAAGKGVTICGSYEEAEKAVRAMMVERCFGEAGEKVVIEEFLNGIEFSVFVLTDGESWCTLPVAKDYKRIGEGDTGSNTGGMGAVSPVPFVDEALMEKVTTRIIQRTVEGLKAEGIDYRGFIYFGLMNCQGDPYVVEYNVRLGDPEAQVVLPRLKSDLVELFIKTHRRQLSDVTIEIDPRPACTVVLASQGYPGSYEKGKEIKGLEVASDVLVFHAGTQRVENRLITSGGRVMSVTALGSSLEECRERCLSAAEKITFEGKYYRKDIGRDVLEGVGTGRG